MSSPRAASEMAGDAAAKAGDAAAKVGRAAASGLTSGFAK
eukprot:COSAG02_NODE_30899_length_543_cov_0.806306_1_plen_39_part_10